jgi:hypothetical protein
LSADCDADREAVTALVGKALVPGSSSLTDRWIRRLTRGRRIAADRIDVAIDPRLWAYWTVTSGKRHRLMADTLLAEHQKSPSDAQITASVVRLTLDPCRDSCPECLGTAGEMRGLLPSRRLARQWLNLDGIDRVIEAGLSDNWLKDLDDALATANRLRLRFPEALRARVASALAERLARRYDRGFAASGFRVTAITRRRSSWEAVLRLDDVEIL